MNKKVILLAEPNELLGTVLSQRLSLEGYQVVVAANGLEAMEILDTQNVSLLVTEDLLPYKNGSELIAIANEKNIQVIVIGDSDVEEKIMEAFELGAIDFIHKPFSPTELVVRVKNALRSAKNISSFPFKLK